MPHDMHEQVGIGINGKIFVTPSVEYGYQHFGTVAVPYITITLIDYLMLQNVLLLL